MNKWASFHDLMDGIPKSVIDNALEAAWCYTFDACNWEIELSSSTSGMYGSWYITISPNTTVKDLRVFSKVPKGVGGSLSEAITNFTEKMIAFNKEHGFERFSQKIR